MIVFDLTCDAGHRFEGWFGSSREFAEQQERGLVACPQCGSPGVAKAPMAPAVPRKGGARAEPVSAPRAGRSRAMMAGRATTPEVAEAFARLAAAQRRSLRHSRWVGTEFAETSRAMHYGERAEEAIHGRASADEARSLVEEGIPIAPLVIPIAPPDEIN